MTLRVCPYIPVSDDVNSVVLLADVAAGSSSVSGSYSNSPVVQGKHIYTTTKLKYNGE